jgi:hypothetical protein
MVFGKSRAAKLLAPTALFFFRPWVRLVVNLRQVLKIQVGINLRGGNICVAE